MTPSLVLFAVVAAAASSTEPLDLVSDVSGYSLGVDAIPFDPAAPAWADGTEVQLRHLAASGERGSTGLYGLVPLGPLALSGAYEWTNEPGLQRNRGTLGLSALLGRRLSAGFAYRSYSSRYQAYTGAHGWDLGLMAQPWPWLSLSTGFDRLGHAPLVGGERESLLRFGAAVRPLMGSPFVTLAADTRLRTSSYHAAETRFLVDVTPLEGVHAFAALSTADSTRQLWLGASLALSGLETRAVALASAHGPGPGGGDREALSVTARGEAAESALRPTGRTVEMQLSGDLEPEDDGLSLSRPAISVAALQLDRLASDTTVGTVVLDIGRLEVGMATVNELRQAIHRLRAAGKTVVAELSSGEDKSYLVAAAADRVRLDPGVPLQVNGFAVTLQYFADALAKIGVRFDAVEIGRYKSGPDSLTRDRPRPEEVQVQKDVLDQAYRTLVDALTVDRKLPGDAVARCLAQGAFTAKEALAAGLVDELTQPTDPTQVPTVRVAGESFAATRHPSGRWSQPPIIAIVPVLGSIVVQDGDSLLPGRSTEVNDVLTALEEAREDEDVKGVVLRIDSPGGDVYASELIWRAVRRVKDVKPVVVSMGDVAASGGYYAAAAADVILAQPNTITGSIGIFTVKADLSRLLDWAGIRSETLKIGEHADWDSASHPLRPEDRARLEHILRSYYDDFVARVAAGRNMTSERARGLAEGRVYTGQQALAAGLVDAMGGLAEALREVRSRAGLDERDEIEVQIPRRSATLRGLVSGLVSAQAPLATAWKELSRRVQAIEGKPLALMPFAVEVGP